MAASFFSTITAVNQELRILVYDSTLWKYTFITMDAWHDKNTSEQLWNYAVTVVRYRSEAAYVFQKGIEYKKFDSASLHKAKKWAKKHSVEERELPYWWKNQCSVAGGTAQARCQKERWEYQSYLEVMTSWVRKRRKPQELEYYI